MSPSIIAVAAAIGGLVVGAGGAIVLRPAPAPQPPTQDQLAAAIVANPALCPKPEMPAVEIPTVEEATAAYRKKRGLPEATLRMGDCSANTMGPGVQCTVKFRGKPTWNEQSGVIAFSRGPDGWQAVPLY